jgi:hypothetical protein
MNYIYTKISLDVQNIASQLTLSVKRGDTSRGLMISLTDNGKVYNIPDHCYATFSARKSDGTFVDSGCTIKDNFIIFEFSEQLTIISGRVDCDITLYDVNNYRLLSPLFTIYVYDTIKSEYARAVVSSDEFTMLTELISDATEAIVDTNNATANANAAAEEAREKGDSAVELANEAIATANEANETARGHLHYIQTTDDGKLQILDADMNVITTIDTFCGDDDTLHRYVDGMLSVIGIKERNKDNTYRVWVGTHEEYTSLSEIDPSTFYWVTDDNSYEEFVATVNALIDDHNGLVEAHNALSADYEKLKTDLGTGDFKVKKAETCDYSPYYIDMTSSGLDDALKTMESSFDGETSGDTTTARKLQAFLEKFFYACTKSNEKPVYIRIKEWVDSLGGYAHMVIPVTTSLTYSNGVVDKLYVDFVWGGALYHILIMEYHSGALVYNISKAETTFVGSGSTVIAHG